MSSAAFGLRCARRDAVGIGTIEGECREFAKQRVRERQLFEAERAADPFGVAVAGIVAQPNPIGLRLRTGERH